MNRTFNPNSNIGKNPIYGTNENKNSPLANRSDSCRYSQYAFPKELTFDIEDKNKSIKSIEKNIKDFFKSK